MAISGIGGFSHQPDRDTSNFGSLDSIEFSRGTARGGQRRKSQMMVNARSTVPVSFNCEFIFGTPNADGDILCEPDIKVGGS